MWNHVVTNKVLHTSKIVQIKYRIRFLPVCWTCRIETDIFLVCSNDNTHPWGLFIMETILRNQTEANRAKREFLLDKFRLVPPRFFPFASDFKKRFATESTQWTRPWPSVFTMRGFNYLSRVTSRRTFHRMKSDCMHDSAWARCPVQSPERNRLQNKSGIVLIKEVVVVSGIQNSLSLCVWYSV